MRIVLVLAGLGAGGTEKIVNLLAHHRLAMGDEVHVLALNSADAFSYFPYDPAITVEGLNRRDRLAGYLTSTQRLLDLRNRLAVIQPDAVISFLSKVNVIVTLVTTGSNVATIISERNNFDLQRMNPFWRWMRPLTARMASRIVMQTEKARARLPVRLWEKVSVIPNPVTPLPRAAPRSNAGDRVIAVGRLDRQKGFDRLIDAFAGVVSHIPTATLTIYGEGPERPALEKQISDLELDGTIRLPGTSRMPGEWLSAGDIFVLSSRFEGFPNVLLEAMLGGMAVVSFDCPWGPSEIVEDGVSGMLVSAGDTRALAGTVTRLLSDPDLRRRLCEVAPQSLDRYSTASVLDKWDDAIARATVRQPVTFPAKT